MLPTLTQIQVIKPLNQTRIYIHMSIQTVKQEIKDSEKERQEIEKVKHNSMKLH